MNYYLVDYENVKTQGLNGVNKLQEDDVVCIFYSENADNLTFGLHRRLNESVARIEYHKVEVGYKNALDFQLSTHLGYVIHKNEANPYDYYIVAKDKGYDCLVSYWKKKAKVCLVADVARLSEQSIQNELEKQVEAVIDDKAEVVNIVKMIKKYKTKQGIHNALIKAYPSKDNKKASKIYGEIKPLLTDKKGK